MTRWLALSSAILLSVLQFQMESRADEVASIPAPAQASGFLTRTFASTFSQDTVFLGEHPPLERRFSWYPWHFFGHSADLSSIRSNGDGSITLLGDKTGPNGQLTTAFPIDNAPHIVGTAFGGGGYFEAILSFDPKTVDRSNGWPAFWSMAVEHLAHLPEAQWAGEEQGYEHFIEADFFEYDLECGPCYGGSLHDWSGIEHVSCGLYCSVIPPKSVFRRPLPPDVDFRNFHRYGFLWIPATEAKKGIAAYYFDGKEVGTAISWEKLGISHPPVTRDSPGLFGIIDEDHLVVILGTGVGQPLNIRSVSVWQKNDRQNISYPPQP